MRRCCPRRRAGGRSKAKAPDLYVSGRGGHARTPAASLSGPASKHTAAAKRSPICGMRPSPPRYYNLANVEPGALITPLLRPPGFPFGFAPVLFASVLFAAAFLMYR